MARKTTAEIRIRGTDDGATTTADRVAASLKDVDSAADGATRALDNQNNELNELDRLAREAAEEADRLSRAEDNVASSARPAAAAVDKLGDNLQKADASTSKARKGLSGFVSFLKSRFVITLGDVANAARAAFDIIKEASNLKSQEQALRISLAKQGQDFDTYIAKLDEVARGTISTSALIQSSSKALLLGIPAEEIAGLLEIARASAIATGQSVQQAFDDIATGIGRSSPLILDNLGIVVKLGPAYEAYADSIGKATTELTAMDQKQALLNEVLKIGKTRVEEFGEAADETAEQLQRGQAALDGYRKSIGNVTSFLSGVAIIIFSEFQIMLLETGIAIQQLRLEWNIFTGDLSDISAILKSQQNLENLRKEALETQKSLTDLAESQFDQFFETAAERTERLALELEDASEKAKDMAASAALSAVRVNEMSESLDDATESSEALTLSYDGALLPSMQLLDSTLQQTASSADLTAQAFDRLASSSGRAAAVSAAAEANIRAGTRDVSGLHFFGTRVRIPGGSRLVRPFGSGFTTIGDSCGKTGTSSTSQFGGSIC